jgi:hypothetical protein
MVKIWLYFHKSIWVAIFVYFSIPLSQKHMFLKALHGSLFIWTLWIFFSGFPNLKMTSATLNTSFHIDLGRFVGDWQCIIQKIKIIFFSKVKTMSNWIIKKNLLWTYKECNCCRYWATYHASTLMSSLEVVF